MHRSSCGHRGIACWSTAQIMHISGCSTSVRTNLDFVFSQLNAAWPWCEGTCGRDVGILRPRRQSVPSRKLSSGETNSFLVLRRRCSPACGRLRGTARRLRKANRLRRKLMVFCRNQHHLTAKASQRDDRGTGGTWAAVFANYARFTIADGQRNAVHYPYALLDNGQAVTARVGVCVRCSHTSPT